ncbi:MAG TPA: biotin/lipoyl-binding protein [Clostridiales bacterium]|jgi:biotin carboxyl carrier protein|nr:biotin/lipoyl-binding protein [Clostridiales bacterium]
MRKYNVKLNGQVYEVEVEEIQEGSAAVESKSEAPKAQPKVTPSEGESILAPMPGTILRVNIKEGDHVKKNDCLFILEAMKLENEIMAPRDCKIVSVNVTQGTSVNAKDLLCVIE